MKRSEMRGIPRVSGNFQITPGLKHAGVQPGYLIGEKNGHKKSPPKRAFYAETDLKRQTNDRCIRIGNRCQSHGRRCDQCNTNRARIRCAIIELCIKLLGEFAGDAA